MPSLELLIAFFVTTAIFAFMPGPAMLYVAARTMAAGRGAGLMASLGVHIGCYVHVVAAAAGLSVLFHAVPALYLAVKLAGAAYLVWLGILMFRDRGVEVTGAPVLASRSGRRAFVESAGVEILNPKTALFFLAFLPQFVDASAAFPVWLQFVILGTVVNAMFSTADVVCVLLAGAVMRMVRASARAQRLIQRAGGAVLVGLGFHLAFQKS